MKKVAVIILCLTLVVCNLTACKKEVKHEESSCNNIMFNISSL